MKTKKSFSSFICNLTKLQNRRNVKSGKKNALQKSRRNSQTSRVLRLESLEERQLLSVTAIEYNQIRNNYPTYQLAENINDNNIIELTPLIATNLQNAINQATQTDFDDLIVIRNFDRLIFENELVTIDLDDGSHGKLSIVGLNDNNLVTFDDLIDSQQYTVKGDGFFNGQTWFAPMKDFVFDTTNEITPQTVETKSLIGLNELRNDSRFSFAKGTNYTTVIIDTGINSTHNYFKDSEGNSRIVYQYDFADNDADATDYQEHGTNVAGIAAGTVGVASDANIIALKVSKNNEGSSMSRNAVINACEWVIANQERYNITSVNMSFGTPGTNYNVYTAGHYHDVLTRLNEMGVIVCAAAGNSFYEHNSVEGLLYPAAEESVVSVGAVFDANVGSVAFTDGAVANSTTADQIVCFSQRSSTMLSIMAPGGRLTSAGIGSNTAISRNVGTSLAAPVMSGVAVLAQEIANHYLDRPLTVSEFKSLIKETGKDIFDGTYDDGAIEDDNVTNTEKWYKRIDVYALAEAIYEMGGIIVDSLEDTIDATDGKTTLREAITIAQVGDSILFAKSLNGQTITLSGTELEITKAITIDASALSDGITINADSKSRVFNINDETDESISVTLTGLIITGGITDADADGGGIYNRENLTLTSCTISENSASYAGGGICNNEGTLTLTNCTVSENSAYSGGGLRNFNGTLTLTNCTVSGNSASGNSRSNGGGICNYEGTLTLTNCTVSENSATDEGGGIYNDNTLTMTNCTISDNSAFGLYSNGGGIYNEGTLTLTNCTVSGNSASTTSGIDSYGGGICNYDGTLTLYNSIVTCNTASGFENDIENEGGLIYACNTLSSYTTWNTGTENLVYDSSKPLFTDASNNDYTLAPHSQAINKGNNTYAVDVEGNPLLYDLAGKPRIANNIVDLGAYEYQQQEPISLVVDSLEDTINAIDGKTTLREAIANAKAGETITFKSSLNGQTITLSGKQLEITKAITIDASTLSNGITINAMSKSSAQ